MDNRAIGILDSGIGGLTVAKEIRELMPCEDLLYYGDTLHCPYGLRTEEEILELSRQMLDYFRRKDVKVAVIACNTISTLVDQLKGDYDFPIFSIIDPVVEHLKDLQPKRLGFLSTAFTIQKGTYRQRLAKHLPQMQLIEDSSKVLATIIDSGNFESEELRNIVERKIQKIQSQGGADYLLLACTHYPIIRRLFEESAGDAMPLIDPARHQARRVLEYLEKEHRLSQRVGGGHVRILSSGDLSIYEKTVEHLSIEGPVSYRRKVLKKDSFFGHQEAKKKHRKAGRK